MRLEVITPPASEPVTLAEAKVHLRVTATSDDAWITDAIVGAREQVEELTRRRLITQAWRVYFDRFPGQGWFLDATQPFLGKPGLRSDFFLPDVAPVSAITALKYFDGDGVLQTLDPATYQLVPEAPARVALAYGQSWPSARGDRDGVRIEITCGYGAAAAVPRRCKQAMYLLLSHWYEHRSEITDFQTYQLPAGAENILSSLVVPAF